MRLLLALLMLLLPLPVWAQGAVETGNYPNLFADHLGASEKAVDAKMASHWKSLFGGEEGRTVYYAGARTVDGPSAYILDVGNGDVRSEGMSYSASMRSAPR